MFRFSKTYFILAILLFLTEVLIALYVHDSFIRPYFGDVLVVILIYCFVKSFFKVPAMPLAIGILLFAFMVETLQYFEIVKKLGLEHSKLANVVIGNSFAWADMWCYMAGIAIVLIAEYLRTQKSGKVAA